MSAEPVFACYGCGERYVPFRPDLPDDAVYISLYEGSDTSGCRAIVICSTCMGEGGFDMWTDQAEWDSQGPVVPYSLLPPFDHDDPEREDPAKYPTPQALLAKDRSER